MSRKRSVGSPCWLLVLTSCLTMSACSGKKTVDLPKTFAVKGKVVYQEGGRPMGEGTLQLEPLDIPAGPIALVGTIQADGSFTLHTINENAKLPGAPEGSYRIRVIPSMGADQQDNSVVLHGPYKVEPHDNNTFNLTIPGKAPSP